MPQWAEYVLWSAALVTALGVLFTKVIRPTFKAASAADQMIPLLRELTLAFANTPHAFAVLDEIVAQFRTDSGSSLKDAVNRLEASAQENKATAAVLAVGVEAAKQLATQDRAQIADLLVKLDRNTVRLDTALEILGGVEATARRVASDLVVAQAAVDGVASDLANAHKRADATTGDPGAAADAAVQTKEG